ncbi:MAG: hypothetical protein GKR98_10350 [Boseongicola sp.]|nr:MAG: hypothetical protein GKR98_10350 [Boseongicola sp.]
MTQMISIARIDRTKMSDNWEETNRALFGADASVEAILPHAEDPNQVAVVLDVKDLEGMRAATRTPEGDAAMRDGGFVEQLCYFIQD